MKYIKLFFYKFFNKFLLFAFFTSLILFFIFPYEKLGESITSQVYEASNETLLIDFSDLSPKIFPLGARFKDFSFHHKSHKLIPVGNLSLSISLFDLLMLTPSLKVHASSLYGGTLNLKWKQLKASVSQDKVIQKIDLSARGINLDQALSNLVDFSKISCQLSLDGSVSITPEKPPSEPSGRLQVNSTKPCLLEGLKVNTAIGPLRVPQLNFTSIAMSSSWKKGEYQLKKLELGNISDELYVKVSGNINHSLVTRKRSPWSAEVEVHVSSSGKSKFKTYLNFLEKYQSTTLTGYKYAFQLEARNLGLFPTLRAK